MSKKIRRAVISALMLITALCVFAGCKLGVSVDDVVDRYDLRARVTYYSNGGQFASNVYEKNLYYSPGSCALEINGDKVHISSNPVSVSRSDYEFVGWYYVLTDDQGKPAYIDQALGLVELDLTKPVDFTVKLQKDDHWYIGAHWMAKQAVEIKLLTSDGQPAHDEEGKEVADGTVLLTYNFGTQGKVEKPGTELEFADYTFSTIYYTSPDCSEHDSCNDLFCEHRGVVEWPLVPTGVEDNVVIYAYYIKGVWEMVASAKDLKDASDSLMFGDKGVYLLKDIDFNGEAFPKLNIGGELAGNGHTIKNAVYTTSIISKNDGSAALFDIIYPNAYMHDISFENITVAIRARTNISIYAYLFANEIRLGARIENVSFSGKMDISGVPATTTILNMVDGEEYSSDHWICGTLITENGSNLTTDAGFFSAYPTFTVTNGNEGFPYQS